LIPSQWRAFAAENDFLALWRIRGPTLVFGFPNTAIRIEAFKMAHSGEYADGTAIERALEKRGHRHARIALQDRQIRAHLDLLCKPKDTRSNLALSPSTEGTTSTGGAATAGPAV
jgi:hypothetical protein